MKKNKHLLNKKRRRKKDLQTPMLKINNCQKKRTASSISW
jgi:ribosomal protein L35AE/L33A